MSSARSCRDLSARSLLLRYVRSDLSEDHAVEFEAHLLCCDGCFHDLKALDRASRLVADLAKLASPAAQRAVMPATQRKPSVQARRVRGTHAGESRRSSHRP